MDRATVEELVAERTGRRVADVGTVGGGDTSRAARVSLDDGSTCFLKWAGPRAASYVREADDLRWLGSASAVPVPEVLGVGDGDDGWPAHLLLEWVEPGRPRAGTEAELGRALAGLHRSGASGFGRADRRPTGSLGLPNEPQPTWSDHLRSNRLLPLVTIGEDRSALPPELLDGVRRVAERVEALVPPAEPPSRLHGDLWAGNRLVDAEGRSWLIDPAAHGGHREFDLAMMRLFGGYGPEVFEAYEDVAPLAAGWEERIVLHQLVPLVVHAVKFGGAYVGAVRRCVDELLGG